MWNCRLKLRSALSRWLQIISQNYVVWNALAQKILKFRAYRCKLYHKTTWFETCSIILDTQKSKPLQIISQNYVVWNFSSKSVGSASSCCKLYHKTTWFETRWWRKRYICAGLVANYITKLRGLKLKLSNALDANANALQIISQNYVVWNLWPSFAKPALFFSCKLYHKTTWFETQGVMMVHLKFL